MSRPTKADRQIKYFEDGELWSADDAMPPSNPAGWYVLPRGTSSTWIGPFVSADMAANAPMAGDPIAAARRRLDAWMHAEMAPDAVHPPDVAPEVEAPAVPESESPQESRQLNFGFDEAGPIPPDERPARKRRKASRSPPPEQGKLPL